jgi:uncharacterized Zn finger protein
MGRVIKIYCQKCGTLLYEYWKAKPGHLVKCYQERILKDYTKGDLKCPKCGLSFARETKIYKKPAYKIIQGKVRVK